MLILIAPDSFKGSLTAASAAAAMTAGARVAVPDADLAVYPMADGGEGTIDALTDGHHFTVRRVRTVDAIGRPHVARYAVGREGRVIVELAQASGLPQVADHPAPLIASTRGTGQVIAEALEAGGRDLLLCLGGTATTDGGAGILRALGARLLDARGDEVDDGGAALSRISRIDMTGLVAGAREAQWRLACDVDNPLTGLRGAAAVFGPQKGATPADVAQLDAALDHWTEVLARDVGPVDADAPGMGAAGGTPVALTAAFGARLVPGARLVADAIGLTARLAQADVLVTGEGSFDAQSLTGKVVGTLTCLASGIGVPVLVVAGSVAAGGAGLASGGLASGGSASGGSASAGSASGGLTSTGLTSTGLTSGGLANTKLTNAALAGTGSASTELAGTALASAGSASAELATTGARRTPGARAEAPGTAARRAGIVGARSIADGPCTLDDLMTEAAHRIEATTADMLATFTAGMNHAASRGTRASSEERLMKEGRP
ncbi:MAG: glycerate kinase [Bifidobacteriaceae bacterium]|nr:glycerate kinase [Bifidobacteriaceae bacterium]